MSHFAGRLSLLRGRFVSCQVNARHPTPLLLGEDYQVAAGPFHAHGHGEKDEGETTQCLKKRLTASPPSKKLPDWGNRIRWPGVPVGRKKIGRELLFWSRLSWHFVLTVVCLFNFISGRVTSQKRSHVEQTIRLSVVMEAEIFQYTIAQSHR
jgi:hypothetical protein